MKDLVLGFSTNQEEQSLRVFCSSLRKLYTPERCDLVIITNRYEAYFADLAREGVLFVSTANSYPPTNSRLGKAAKHLILSAMRPAVRSKLFGKMASDVAATYPVLLETWHHPQCSVRWIAFERFLTLNRGYGQVFLSDVRDVVFQAPLFDNEPGESVCLFDQSETYGTVNCDTNWYRDAWGEEALVKVIGKRALNIGTILGPHHAVLSFVSEFCAFFEHHPFAGVDQVLFNYMLLNNLVKTPYRIIENVSGPVATLSNDMAHDATETRDGYVRRATDGSIIPAVHMYDRWPDTKDLHARPRA